MEGESRVPFRTCTHTTSLIRETRLKPLLTELCLTVISDPCLALSGVSLVLLIEGGTCLR